MRVACCGDPAPRQKEDHSFMFVVAGLCAVTFEFPLSNTFHPPDFAALFKISIVFAAHIANAVASPLTLLHN